MGHFGDKQVPVNIKALQQAVELHDIYQEKIQACDTHIRATLETFADRSEGAPVPKRSKDKGRKRRALAPAFNLHPELFRMTGVDVTSLDGIAPLTALQILSETGLDPSPWPTEKHFASCLGLCPGSKKSGGNMLSSRTKSSANRAAAAFPWRPRVSTGAAVPWGPTTGG